MGLSQTERKAQYYLACISVNYSIFAGDIEKYRFLQMQYLTFEKYDCKALAFALTDNRLYVLLEAYRQQSVLGVAENVYDPYRKAHTNEKSEIIAQMAREVLERKYLPFYKSLHRDDKRFCHIDIMTDGPYDQSRLANLTGKLHMLPVRAGLTNDPKGWYWTSYKAYHADIQWDFLDTSEVMMYLDADPQCAVKALFGYEKRIAKALLHEKKNSAETGEDTMQNDWDWLRQI